MVLKHRRKRLEAGRGRSILLHVPFAALIWAAALFLSEGSDAAPRWYSCTAWGSSHTGRYTFRIDTEPCRVYWREIEADLVIETCAPPRIVAVKPFAVSSGYVVEFNLTTGRFEDFTPAFSDRGRCEPLPDGEVRP